MLKVSLIIPVYNGSNYLANAINSALSQEYKELEIIVINDGSTDNDKTKEIALSYKDRIRYFEKENGGVASALNLGISKMDGDYFSWLSHDDLYRPNKISSQINYLLDSKLNSKNVILYSDFSLINENGDIFWNSDLSSSLNYSFRMWLTLFSQLNGCTLLIPKAAFDKIGRFDESLKHTQDYDLWSRLSYQYDFVYVPINLVESRQHSEQDSRKLNHFAFEEVSKLKSRFVKGLNKSDFLSIKNTKKLLVDCKNLFEHKIYYSIVELIFKYFFFKSIK
jgi:glycosyltransferase involved in cell wall biosynthesis